MCCVQFQTRVREDNSLECATVIMGNSPRCIGITLHVRTSKLRVNGLGAGNSPETCEFSAQGPVTRKMFPFDDVIMIIVNDMKSDLVTNTNKNKEQ